jgi:ubiquinone/menaquinone biosynthesis C-methylase UbiE
MSDARLQLQIDAASAYEDLFVPALFGQWTSRIAESADVGPGQRVLDVACGTGVLSREVARRVGDDGHAAGLDLLPGMLEVARRVSPEIEWRQGNAAALPWPDQTFDAVVSQFGMMFFPEPEQALQEMLRVLVPGGRIAVAVWDAIETMPAYAEEVALLERFAGSAAADALRAPFTLGERKQLHEIARAAGAADIAVETLAGMACFPGIRSLVEADLRGWLPVMGIFLEEPMIQQILAEAEVTHANYIDPRGRAVFALSAHILTGART